MIELDNISVSLPLRGPHARTILENISLTIRDGEWVAVAGPNGSGKSTLLRTIAGLCPPSAGRLRVEPTRASDQRTPVALLLQEPDNQFVASSVRHELLLSLDPSLARAARDERMAGAVERFSLHPFLDRNPHRLSGGEKQRLALATVWLSDPQVLLLDEPASYLDAEERARCVSFTRELNRGGVTVVWATPGGDDLTDAGRVVYLENGGIRFDGPADRFVGEARSKDLDVLLPDAESAPSPAVASRFAAGYGERFVTMHSLSFRYDEADVLRQVTGEIRSREAVGIAGRVGSGKSTLLSLIGGVLEPTAGTIHRWFTKPVEKRNGRREQAVFYLFQSPEKLFFAETVFEEVAFGLKSLGVARGEWAGRVRGALSRVGLAPESFLQRLPFSLSLGEMRRLAFAIADALRPKLLLLDEPTSCLDAAGRRMLAELIGKLRSEGATVVTASHDADMLRRTMDRCLTIEDGRLIGS
jgi:energy-coupling factor transporter ATP-binding protein EcfA2